jgi:transposase
MNSSNGSNNRQRRYFADSEKVTILKRHLIDKVPVSDLCDELDIYPNQFYDWLKKFFENGHLAFANGRKAKAVEDAQQARIQQLEAKLTRKNEVMAELMEALTEEKKRNGEL